MNRLCKRIVEEKDPEIFNQLVKALNDLLETKHDRIRSDRTNG